MDSCSNLTNNTSLFNNAPATGRTAILENKDADTSTKAGSAWARQVSTICNKKEESYLSDKSECNNPTTLHNDLTKKTVTTIKGFNNKEESCVENKPTKQHNDVTKEEGVIDHKKAYIKYKTEINELTNTINSIRKQIDSTLKDSGSKSKSLEIAEANVNELTNKLDSLTKSMECHKKKIGKRKSIGFISNKVVSLINKAIPDCQKSRPRSKSLRERLTSVCTNIKNSLQKTLSNKGLIKVLKVIRNIMVITGAVIIINAVFIGVAVGLYMLSPFMGIVFAVLLFAPDIWFSITTILGLDDVFIVRDIKEKKENENERRKIENRTPLEEIQSIANCLTKNGSPDVSTIVQLITNMEDSSFLSGDSDYDDIYNKLITYLQKNKTIADDLIDCANAQDRKTLKDMKKIINNNNNSLSLTEINKCYELIKTSFTDNQKDGDKKSIEQKLSDKVLLDLKSLPDTYELQPLEFKSWDDDNITLKKNETKRYVVTASFSNDKGEVSKSYDYDIHKFIDYLKHISLSIDMIERCKNNIELSENQRRELKRAIDIHNHLHDQLMDLCPTYKKEQDLRD